MNFIKNKYSRKTGILLIISYLLLLSAGIADLHHVDITAGKISISSDAAQSGTTSGYLFNDESKCLVHKAFTSIHQVVFYSSLLQLKTELPVLFLTQENKQSVTRLFLSGNSLRAPPSA